MKRSIGILLVLVGSFLPLGCGAQNDPDSQANTVASNRSATAVSTGGTTVPPNEIVAMFSDSIRRGDKETTIKLITLAAREEIQRRGMTIDPPGSPEASYKIGEVRFLDQDRDAAYVESLWIEPGANGQASQETEVVWAVQLEPEGWRISGLAIDMGPDQQPTLVDFENLEVAEVETAANPAPPAVAANGNPPATGLQPPPASGGIQALPASSIQALPATAGNPAGLEHSTQTPPPSANGFTMPPLGAPQISQPPNTQFR